MPELLTVCHRICPEVKAAAGVKLAISNQLDLAVVFALGTKLRVHSNGAFLQ
jgi:hypothetical protein